MTKNPEEIQTDLEKKTSQRLKKKRLRMKVSGASVKQLQKLIISKVKKKK